MNRREVVVAPLCEATLIGAAGVLALLLHKPLFFASLGPTAYEIVETPGSPTASPYNIVMGHLTGVVCGFAALAITHAWSTPAVSTSNISPFRVIAAVLAAILTVAGTYLLRAQQPAALSTTLMVATGSMQRLQDGVAIMGGILLITALGEPIRQWRIRQIPPSTH